MTGWPILSLVVFTPLIGVALILFVPKDNHRLIRGLALMAALASLVFSLRLLGYEPSGAEFQYREDISWIAAFCLRPTTSGTAMSASSSPPPVTIAYAPAASARSSTIARTTQIQARLRSGSSSSWRGRKLVS